MLDDVIEIVDRQFDFLKRQDDPRCFLTRLGPVLENLRSDPRIDAVVTDLVQESTDVFCDYNKSIAAMQTKLVAMRKRLADVAPNVAPMSKEEDLLNENKVAFHGTLLFDRLSSEPLGDQFPSRRAAASEDSGILTLIVNLFGLLDLALKQSSSETIAEVQRLRLDLTNLRSQCEHA